MDYFLKSIRLEKEKAVRKARIYATACGIYEISLNGEKAGDFCLAPGYTDYNKRIQYQTIDVTELVKRADRELAIQVELASGWYRGSIGAHGLRCEYGTETKFLLQLEITYEDGSCQTVCSDSSWKWSNDGAVRYADNKDGEYIDANSIPSFSGGVKLTKHSVIPTASNNVPLTEHEQFKGVISKSPSGKIIVNFGQNLAGFVSMQFSAHKGQVIRLRFGELLGKDGELIQTNIQCISKRRITPLQEILYVCKEGVNSFKNRFSIFGFQYIEIETVDLHIDERDYFKDYYEEVRKTYDNAVNPVALKDLSIEAIAVYSDIEELGYFESSNQLLNQFVHATKWSTKGNLADIPTDCPTRERHGWTGDAQIFFKTASYLFDYAAFSQKYLRDVYDWQKKNGRLPQIAPYGGVDFFMQTMNGSVGWSDVGVLIPYYFYQMNGDVRILEEYYDRMKKYASFMQNRCGKWGGPYARSTGVKGPYKKYVATRGQSYDEWAEPQDVKAFHWTDFAAPHPEVQTAYTAHIMHVMCDIAKATGHDGEKEKGAVENIVAIDGIAVITDKKNTVADLTSEQLAAIYTGEITNWSELGGSDEAIVVIGREAGSGTRSAFEELLEVEDTCKYAQELDSTGAVLAKVAATTGAIGYVSLDVVDDTVNAVSLNGAPATEESILAGDYLLSRPFVMATMGEISEQNELVQTWFNYIASEEGKSIISGLGLILPQ